MVKPLPTLILIILLSVTAMSQNQRIQGFSENDEEFILELSVLVDGLDRQERLRAQVYMDTFAAVWHSDLLNKDQKTVIKRTMNSLVGLRLRPWPDYMQYLNGVVKVIQTPQGDRNFDAWHAGFRPLLNANNLQRLTNFWQKNIDLFDENIVFSSSSVRWQLRDNNYLLSFEDGNFWISFQDTDLVCYSQGDSTVIYNTSARINLNEEKLWGQGGKITWERVALDPDKVYAIMGEYEINIAISRFEAESVTFYNLNFFTEPLFGKLTERIMSGIRPEDASYPRFQSYQAFHEIKDVFPGIDFRGGFTMMGNRILGTGTDETDATLKFYRSDSLFISARSRSFSIRPDRIATERAEVSIYLAGDSIHHPSVNMRYLDPVREFSLQRDERGASRAPFNNTFHRVDMYCEAIYWNIDTYDIELRMVTGMSEKGNAVFESHNFFSELRYMRMQGISELHPLIRLRNFAREYDSRTFPVSAYARYLRQNVASVEAQLLTFSFYGFLSYDIDNQMVTLHDRLYHYLTSYTGRSDFDVIQINSEAPVNGRLNMNNFDLHLYGVDRIPLSREKNVIIHPYNEEVILKQNRDMYFHGRIESGLFDFYGKEFFFDYDMFKIDLVNTDSMSFRVRSHEPDERGRYTYHRVQTVLEGINGELLVDHPGNKSGQMPIPRYPIFNSNNESFMYYDRETVHEGVYDRETVYLRLIPFSIDSLDNATTDNIAFDGVFISTGIFPDFVDYVTVQEDYSLGFNTHTPEGGYEIYGGKAVYKGPIRMSNRGLHADGRLEFLDATVDAHTMLMFPDSVSGKINAFNLKAKDGPTGHPKVAALDVDMAYLPFQDRMEIKNTTRPFEVYDGRVQMEGSMQLTPEGLTGKGRLELFGSTLLSDNVDLKVDDFTAENSTLNLMTADGRNLAVRATNYNAHVDVAKSTSQFESITGLSKMAFQINEFDALGYDWHWDMARGDLTIQSSLHQEISAMGEMKPEDWIHFDFSGHELVSTHRAQDSLRFYAGNIQYNLAENTIHADDVKIIKVADAAIYPHNEKVTILQRAEIGKLENAIILANTSTLKHRFYDAEVNITSRLSYRGSGMYDYRDVRGDVQNIFFNSISVDRVNRTTLASAEISEEQNFTISPWFGFYGDLGLRAEKAEFNYRGAAEIFVDCPNYRPDRIRFEAEARADSVFIPLAEDLRNEANGRIISSIMLAGDSVHIYPGLFTRRRHYSDMEIIGATGYLTYDNGLNQYQVSTLEKLRNQQLADNIITINPNTCVFDGHGNITLTEDMGQVKLVTHGRINHDLKENETSFDLVVGLDFFFLNAALAAIENNIRNMGEPRPLNLNRFNYTAFLQKTIGRDNSRRLMDEYALTGSFRRFPPELNHTFFFADVKMKWNEEAQTFHSVEPLGLANMERFPLNTYVDGFLEVRKTRNEDFLSLILVPSGLTSEGIGPEWYFFTYANNIMQTIAASPEYNDMIRSVSPRRRRMNVGRGERPFTYILAADRRPFDFVRSMRRLKE